ncbi:hypothetical protein E2320_022736, partial [Naja naja]
DHQSNGGCGGYCVPARGSPEIPDEWSGSTSIQRMERDLLGQATLSDLLIDRPLTAAREQHWKSNAEKQPKRQFTRRSVSRQGEGHQTAAPPTSMKCFRCGQQGCRASECLAPAPVLQGRAPAPPKWKKRRENLLRKANLCAKPSRSQTPNKTTGEGTLAAGAPFMQDADSEEDDP